MEWSARTLIFHLVFWATAFALRAQGKPENEFQARQKSQAECCQPRGPAPFCCMRGSGCARGLGARGLTRAQAVARVLFIASGPRHSILFSCGPPFFPNKQSVPKKDQMENFKNTPNGGNRKWNKNGVAIHRKHAVYFSSTNIYCSFSERG